MPPKKDNKYHKNQSSQEDQHQQPHNNNTQKEKKNNTAASATNATKTNIPCKYFMKGYCKFGQNCPDLHNNESGSHHRGPSSTQPKNYSGGGPEPCNNFRKGNCNYGQNCRYLHNDGSSYQQLGGPASTQPRNYSGGGPNFTNKSDNKKPHPPRNNAPQNSSVSSPVVDFCKTVVVNNKLTKLNKQQLKTWRACFQLASQSRDDLRQYILSLCKMYLNLTEQREHAPPAYHVLCMIESLLNNNNCAVGEETLKLVKRLFEDRLKRSVSTQTIVDKGPIITSLTELKKRCGILLSTQYSNIIVDLLTLFHSYENDIIKPLDISANREMTFDEDDDDKEDGEGNDEKYADPIFGWIRTPTLQWLCSDEWLTECMQTPLLESYDSVDEYVATLRSVWTLLTFYWGTAACWPKCLHRSGGGGGGGGPNNNHRGGKAGGIIEEKACNEPLLTPAKGHDKCTMLIHDNHNQRNVQVCGNSGKWKCMHPAHRTIICEDCLQKKKEIVLSTYDSRDSSTDIYDGKIFKRTLNHDILSLDIDGFLSRKEPKISPNWRTTYRLKTSGLVAILATNSFREPLNMKTILYWGEIIPYQNNMKNNDDEYRRRERKQLTIRILTKSDGLPLRPMIDLPFQTGSTIAIIDMRVFVPEVISVLGTLFDPSFYEGMKRIPLTTALLGDGGRGGGGGNRALSNLFETMKTNRNNNNNTLLSPPVVLELAIVRRAVTMTIMTSNLKCFQYLKPENKHQIIETIIALPSIQTLDPTQLQAFCYGLSNHFHCTQGPPGTGKSYVGVCLVLALQVIRDTLIQCGHTIGPIITLAYKNHALDELLLDILAASPSLTARNKLIRVGKPEQEELFFYKEHTSKEEEDAKRILENRLSILRDTKYNLNTWINIYSFSNSSLDRLSMFSQGMKLMELSMTDAAQQSDISPAEFDKLFITNNYESVSFLDAIMCLHENYSNHLKELKDDPQQQHSQEDELAIFSVTVMEAFNKRFEDILNDFANININNNKDDGKLMEIIFQTIFQSLFTEAIHWKNFYSRDDIQPLLAALTTAGENTSNLQKLDPKFLSSMLVDLPKALSMVSHEMKLFYLWLEGYSLPARCQEQDGKLEKSGKIIQFQCTECATWDSNYCQTIHKCKYVSCPDSRHVTGYCEMKHSCQFRSNRGNLCCLNVGMVDTGFCIEHACAICCTQPKEKKLNSCRTHRCQAKHLLMNADDQTTTDMQQQQCTNMVLTDVDYNMNKLFPYCEQHFCNICKAFDILSTTSIQLQYLDNGDDDDDDKESKKNSNFCINHTCNAPNCLVATYASGREYCSDHTCRYCDSSIVAFQQPHHQICKAHRCQFISEEDEEYCFEVKLQNNSSAYCLKHTCPICIQLKLPSPHHIVPHNRTCDLHPLCQAITAEGNICDNQAKKDEHYCPLHGKKKIIMNTTGTCCGVTKKKLPCKTKRPDDIDKAIAWYCKVHIEQQKKAATDVKEVVVTMVEIKPILPPIKSQGRGGERYQHDPTIEPKKGKCLKCSVSECKRYTQTTNVYSTTWTCKPHTLLRKQAQAASEYQANMMQQQLAKLHSHHNQVEHEFQSDISASTTARKTEIMEKRKLAKLEKLQKEQQARNERQQKRKGNYSFAEQENIDILDGNYNHNASNPDEMEVLPTDEIKEEEDEDIDDIRKELYQASDDDSDSDDNKNDDEEDAAANLNEVTLKEIYKADFNVKATFEEFLFSKFSEKFSKPAFSSIVSSSTATPNATSQPQVPLYWKLSKSQRHELVQSFFLEMIRFLKQLILLSEPYIDEARREKANANASVFKRATVIGGTVVGASKRLAALRAAEPFAIIVEEACEVMEPTLVSVLAVESLQKLELIGDHRQLPAFVQQCWYNIERSMKSIKISLFERMINSSYGPAATSTKQEYCTVLDIQRRMRLEISNITKPHYLISDAVSIQDHPVTAVQCIGDRFMKEEGTSNAMRDYFTTIRQTAWHDKGRSVPGMQKNIFFWHMENNAESKPIAGLSACNENEANAVVALTQYLLAMRVPVSSISIITPYDGQKRLLVKKLRAANCLAPFVPAAPRPQQHQRKKEVKVPTIIVSTVDRYQGDENDIVILSLVRAKGGNRFVNLLNRFIVATSRARLGFYVIGSTNAVSEAFELRQQEKPIVANYHSNQQPPTDINKNISSRNWFGGLFNNLVIGPTNSSRQQIETETNNIKTTINPENVPASTSVNNNSNHWFDFLQQLQEQDEVGTDIPICCPMHIDTSGSKIPSRSSDRRFPASGTIETLSLRSIQNASATAQSMDIWNKGLCKERCAHKLKCGHACDLPCHFLSPQTHREQTQCQVSLLRPCAKHQYLPLICHEIKFLPNDLTLESALSHWRCEHEDKYRYPTCEHFLTLPCYKYKQILSKEIPLPQCEEKVNDYIHPACNHRIKAPRCFEYQKYVLKPPICHTKVPYCRPCGHMKQNMECHEVPQESEHPSECKDSVLETRPRCQHSFSSVCYQARQIRRRWEQQHDGEGKHIDLIKNRRNGEGENLIVVEEKQSYGCSEDNIAKHFGYNLPECRQRGVVLRRACGHEIIQQLSCHDAFAIAHGEKTMKPCDILVKHQTCKCCDMPTLSLQCSEAKLPGYLVWDMFAKHPIARPNRSLFQVFEATQSFTTSKNTKEEVAYWNILVRGKCATELLFIRKCGHSFPLACYRYQRLLEGVFSIPACDVKVLRKLSCGHVLRDVPCCRQASLPEPACPFDTDEVYTYADCDHILVPKSCAELQHFRKQQKGEMLCKNKISRNLYRCGHSVTIPCYLSKVCESYETSGVPCVLSVKEEGKDVLIVRENMNYCIPSNQLPLCTTAVVFRYDATCNHTTSATCHEAFSWALKKTLPPPCSHLSPTHSHPLCGHPNNNFPCSLIQSLKQYRWDPWNGLKRPLFYKIPSLRNGNVMEEVICFPLPSKPQAFFIPSLKYESQGILQENITSQVPLCSEQVKIYFASSCQHQKRVQCSELYFPTKAIVCEEQQCHICPNPECQKERFYPCAEYRRLQQPGGEFAQACDNIIPKKCTKCQVNSVPTKCSEYQVECHSVVTVALPCGHLKSWICGTLPEDPRNTHNLTTNQNKHCILCAIDAWKALHIFITNLEEDEIDFSLMVKKALQTRLGQAYDEVYDIHYHDRFLYPHISGTNELLTHLIQTLLEVANFQPTVNLPYYLSNMNSPVEIPFPPLLTLNEEANRNPEKMKEQVYTYLMKQYELVFLETQSNKTKKTDAEIDENLENRLKSLRHLTIFGMAEKARKVTKSALTQLNSDGKVRVIVALVWKGHVLTSQARSIFPDDHNQEEDGFISLENVAAAMEKKENTAAAVKLANLLSQRYQSLGYSCVEHFPSGGDNNNNTNQKDEDNIAEYYFWNSAQVMLPVGIFTYKFQVCCCICGEYYNRDQRLGAFCPKLRDHQLTKEEDVHFVCYEGGCFEGYLDAAKQPGSIASYIHPTTKQLVCGGGGCEQGYDYTQLCAFAPEDLTKTLMDFQIQNHVQSKVHKERQEMEKQFAAQLQTEMKNLREMDEETREIELLRKHIIDDILTNKCPGCKMAFLDFDGCCSVTCGNKDNCRIAFCGYCFKDCGGDAHAHAARCEWGIGDVFCDEERLKEIWNDRRAHRIRELLQAKAVNIKRKLQDRMQKDFEDIHLNIRLV